MKYRREIDGLRAIAVLPVILFHAGIEGFSGGFVGVDVFFVISGYLITTILLNDLETERFSVIEFYERRARRILPALFVVMLACLPFAWLWLPPKELGEFSRSMASVAIFGSNFSFYLSSGYFDTANEFKPLIHTWSLSVEEQYYMVFPLFLLCLWRFGRNLVIKGLIVTALVSLVFAQVYVYKNQAFTFYMLPTRAWELLMGGIVALCYSENSIWNKNYIFSQLSSALGICLIGCAIFFYDENTPFPSIYALAPTIGAALLILCATKKTIVGKFLGSRLLVSTGLLSYSAYLWHQPLFAFARNYGFEGTGKLDLIFLAALTMPLSYLTWRFVEQPFRNKNRFNRFEIFLYSGILSVLFIVIGTCGYLTNGFEKYNLQVKRSHVLQTINSSPLREECHTDGENYRKPKEGCEYFTGELAIATLGDSHAVELAYAIAEDAREKLKKVKHLSFSSCEPAYERNIHVDPNCAKWTKEAIEYIANTKSIEYVIISYRLNYYLGTSLKQQNVAEENKARKEMTRKAVWAAYVEMVKKLRENGKKIIVVLQAPELPNDITKLIQSSQNPNMKVAGLRKAEWVDINSFVHEHIHELPSDIVVVDPADRFCDDNVCLASDGAKAYYFDDNHMSVEGARLIAKDISKYIIN